ncbi:DNA polymerase mu [Coprinopsis sp. MPI-PUGE-AT-0042]|nr:DNA polymerase mu [Coprinopsis sp. MPI-PUGE-AT-0042]
MAPKRPPNVSETSSENESPRKRRRRSISSPRSDSDEEDEGLKVYIVQTKLAPEAIQELYELVETGSTFQLELTPNVEDASIIITGIRMRSRLERHVGWKTAQQKAIVTPDWLKDSVSAGKPLSCGKYAAIKELEEQTNENCPNHGPGCRDEKCAGKSQKSTAEAHRTHTDTNIALEPTAKRVFENWRARYAAQRAHPLVCPNQGLAEALSVLCRSRELEGLNINALAYQRAVSMIKACPYKITKEKLPEVSKLPGLGGKIFFKVEEYTTKGSIPEVEETRTSERYQALSSFATIYGIGPTRAREYYDMGMHSITDLERYYDIELPPDSLDPESPESISMVDKLLQELEKRDDEDIYTPNGKKVPTKVASKAPEITIPVALALRRELDTSIPREEVEEIREVIMRELDEFQPGCVSTIVGGYRRGKSRSNDVDIVFTHSDWESGAAIIKDICPRFTAELYRKGLITHMMHATGFHSYNPMRLEHWDTLEKGLTVFRLPETPSSGPRVHRRVDLIFAAPAAYWTAVIGWSGSKMFQRDLRLWAKKEKGLKFDSNGLTRRHDTRLFLPRSEKEVFDILGLDWVDPTMRNADA